LNILVLVDLEKSLTLGSLIKDAYRAT